MANPTTNYGFVLPTSTDLVTDLPADFDVALQGVDTRLKALQPGTTTGDLAYSSATANTNTRLGIGSTGNVLTVAGGVPTWAAPAGGAKPTFQAFKSGSTQNLSANTTTKVTFQSESWDTNSNFASSTFTPTVAGYYQFNVVLNWEPTAAANLRVLSYKNGSAYQNLNGLRANAGETYYPAHGLVYLNGTTDTLEIYANSSTTSSIYQSDASVTYFNAAGANS